MSQAKTVRIWRILKKLIGAHQGAAPGAKFVQCRDYLVDRAITQLIGRYIYTFISLLYHTLSCISLFLLLYANTSVYTSIAVVGRSLSRAPRVNSMFYSATLWSRDRQAPVRARHISARAVAKLPEHVQLCRSFDGGLHCRESNGPAIVHWRTQDFISKGQKFQLIISSDNRKAMRRS